MAILKSEQIIIERVNSNLYNRYLNKIIKIKDFYVSIECHSEASCSPKINIDNPYNYSSYQLTIFSKGDLYIPMGFKEFFNEKGVGEYIKTEDLIKVLKYVSSPIGMMMRI